MSTVTPDPKPVRGRKGKAQPDPVEVEAEASAAEAELADGPQPEAPEEEAPESVEDAEADATEVELVDLPMKGQGGSRASVWTDRLNLAADLLTGQPEGKAAKLATSKSPRGALSRAVDLRKRLKDGRVAGLSDEAQALGIVTRGPVIYAVAPKPAEADAEEQAEEGGEA